MWHGLDIELLAIGSIIYLGLPSGASFWPLNDDHPDATRAPLDQVAAAERQEDETSDRLGQADAELPVGNGEGEGEENAGLPSHAQQFHSGPECQQHNDFGTIPFDYSYPRQALQYPFANVFSHVAPPFLYDFLYVYPYAYGASALHLDYPYVAPHFLYALPDFAFASPYTFHIATSSFPLAHPNPYLYFAHFDNHSYPDFDHHGVIGQMWQREAQEDAFYDETDYEVWNGVPGFNSLSFAGSVENIGPLWVYEGFSSSGLSHSLPEDTETPSTSGLGSSARRRKNSSNEEEGATKKPKWSNDDDSD